MSKKSHVMSLFVLIIASFVFGRSTYVEYLSWYYGSDHLIFSQTNSALLSGLLKEGANKQVISSQADSLIKISRIWADFFPANTSNQPI